MFLMKNHSVLFAVILFLAFGKYVKLQSEENCSSPQSEADCSEDCVFAMVKGESPCVGVVEVGMCLCDGSETVEPAHILNACESIKTCACNACPIPSTNDDKSVQGTCSLIKDDTQFSIKCT